MVSPIPAAIGLLAFTTCGMAADHHQHVTDASLHFTHPLLVDSPSPDDKAHLSYSFERGGHADAHLLHAHAEYRLHPQVSLGLGIPLSYTDDHDAEVEAGNLHAVVKVANLAFADYGVLLTTHLTITAPTGDAHGHHGGDHWVVTPRFGGGWRNEHWEVIAFVGANLPIHHGHNSALAECSLMRHLDPHWSVQVEFQFERSLMHAGEQSGRITLGGLYHTHGGVSLGAGVQLPVSDDHPDWSLITSAMMHF